MTGKYNKRRNTALPIKDILGEILDNGPLKKGISESRAVSYWEQVMGKPVARVTTNIYFRNGTLFVSINSSVVRSELVMLKNKIIARMNEAIGYSVIRDIVFR
ncbi:MAG: DUF721 domain-containing protein [Chlorobi bacterium]|nr:DUF721 domain-containing protein [Chlorobiota bacterium]